MTDGIDISHYQTTVPAGPWLFVTHQATEGTGFTDPTFASRFPTLGAVAPIRGAYHYARPLQSDGTTQANRFADFVISCGFKPGVDMWQLDAEDGENANASWQPFIDQFMTAAEAKLGGRGFLYAGWPFVVAHGLRASVSKWHWWLPDYGPNDGKVHPIQTPSDVSPLVVLHQYTSAGNLDRNVVQNQATWNALTQPAVDLGAIARVLAWLKAVTLSPLRIGDRGPRVQQLNQLLVRHGYNVAGNDYGIRTAAAVLDFKKKHGWAPKDQTGRVCGRACARKLLGFK